MTELEPEYLLALAQQFGFLGAFLGGVSATLFVTLLTLAKPSLLVRWSIGSAALGASCFIITAYMSVGVIAQNHPLSPRAPIESSDGYVPTLMYLSFVIGVFSLLAAIGVSGWTRSKPLGYVTTAVAGLAALPLLADLAS
ncbi:MAG: hypothetical protein ABJN35_05080 [Erythrobacter sp.]|uniref:hypothetical protein n=1 Tax=Erythrobacter sp. Alg231-14 TaxID=1922225 RepID=UPI000D5593E3